MPLINVKMGKIKKLLIAWSKKESDFNSKKKTLIRLLQFPPWFRTDVFVVNS